MTPDEQTRATARMLMLTAGDPDLDELRQALIAFDTVEAMTELALQTALDAAVRIERMPDDAVGIAITDPGDLIAFGMIGHAGEHGRDGLAEHVEHLDLPSLGRVVIRLLLMRRTLVGIEAQHALDELQIPDTAPQEGTR